MHLRLRIFPVCANNKVDVYNNNPRQGYSCNFIFNFILRTYGDQNSNKNPENGWKVGKENRGKATMILGQPSGNYLSQTGTLLKMFFSTTTQKVHQI